MGGILKRACEAHQGYLLTGIHSQRVVVGAIIGR
jgi:hypothetical protein